MQKNIGRFKSPVRIRSDGGHQFISRDFQVFLFKFVVQHVVSTHCSAQSNGHGEAKLTTMKIEEPQHENY